MTVLFKKKKPYNIFLIFSFRPAGTHHPNDVLKMPSLSRNGNGFWLDASTGGMVWRPSASDAMDMQKDQIADYAPVCLTTTTTLPSEQHRNQRYVNGHRLRVYTVYVGRNYIQTCYTN